MQWIEKLVFMKEPHEFCPCGSLYRGSLNIQRAESGEKIFRQTQQKSARVVDPTRRNFVKYHEKDSANSLCDEFLEIPFSII